MYKRDCLNIEIIGNSSFYSLTCELFYLSLVFCHFPMKCWVWSYLYLVIHGLLESVDWYLMCFRKFFKFSLGSTNNFIAEKNTFLSFTNRDDSCCIRLPYKRIHCIHPSHNNDIM